jgi:hypothetical protein
MIETAAETEYEQQRDPSLYNRHHRGTVCDFVDRYGFNLSASEYG